MLNARPESRKESALDGKDSFAIAECKETDGRCDPMKGREFFERCLPRHGNQAPQSPEHNEGESDESPDGHEASERR